MTGPSPYREPVSAGPTTTGSPVVVGRDRRRQVTGVGGGGVHFAAGTERGLSGRRLAADVPWVLGTWLVGAFLFFREQWDSGFKWLMGNDGDTRLAAYFCEHWFRVLHGQASWLNPAFFYPVKGVLGWSDTFLLYEVFYAPLRWLGFDPFVALQVTMILLNLVGFCTFVYLARLAFDTPLPAALLCGCMFTFSNALWLHSASAQLYGIYLVPAILLVGLVAWRSLGAGHRTRAVVLAGMAGLLWALLLFSTYYIGWYSTLALILTCLLALLFGGRALLPRAVSEARAASRWLGGLAAGFLVGLIPFARTYLPNQHRYSYAEVMQGAARLRDLGDVGARNLLWGHLATSVDRARLPLYELSYAVTPVILALTFSVGVFAVWLLWSYRRVQSGPRSQAGRARITLALAVTAFIFLALPVNTRFGSLWAIAWHLPGANGLRAIDRVQLVTALAATLAIAASARDVAVLMGRWTVGRALRLAGLGVLALAVVEQVNLAPTSGLDRPTQVNFVNSIRSAPSACRTFFVVDTARTLPYYDYQLDAMLVAQRLSLPTVNGYTGHFPPGWALLDPSKPGYRAAVAEWANRHGLAGTMCSLDLATMQWQLGD